MKPSSHQHLQSTEYVKAHKRQISYCIGCDRQLAPDVFIPGQTIHAYIRSFNQTPLGCRSMMVKESPMIAKVVTRATITIYSLLGKGMGTKVPNLVKISFVCCFSPCRYGSEYRSWWSLTWYNTLWVHSVMSYVAQIGNGVGTGPPVLKFGQNSCISASFRLEEW